MWDIQDALVSMRFKEEDQYPGNLILFQSKSIYNSFLHENKFVLAELR